MRSTRERLPASPDYRLQLGALGWADDNVAFDAEGDREAVLRAFGAATPFGHALCDGARFLGYFDGGANRVPYAEAAHARPRPIRTPERRP
jgi:hypothetical protein